MAALLILTACVGLVIGAPQGPSSEVKHVDYLMPEVQPKVPDTYLCKAMKMQDVPKYLVGFQPHANMEIAHHILLYGCDEPGSSKPVWNCGEMAMKNDTTYESRPVCQTGAKILYAWAMDAPPLKLPPEVGFEVGGESGINYLVLQVHYKDVTTFLPPHNDKDSSGITMTVTAIPQQRRAGVYLLGTGGQIPAHNTVYMETACMYTENFDIHPFAFRTHAHTLGQVVSGYRIRNGQWTEIGRKSPKKPQMFYNATTPNLVVKRGDILAARCTMKNDLDHEVDVGSTQNDEMCNFYIMYYVDGNRAMRDSYCFSAGPPGYYWKDSPFADKMNLNHIPKTASVIPGENRVIQQTIEPSLYDDSDEYSPIDRVLDTQLYDGNIDYDSMEPDDLAKLIALLQERGPRAYDDEEYY